MRSLRRKQFLSVLCSAAFLFLLLISAFHTHGEADPNASGSECSICFHVQSSHANITGEAAVPSIQGFSEHLVLPKLERPTPVAAFSNRSRAPPLA